MTRQAWRVAKGTAVRMEQTYGAYTWEAGHYTLADAGEAVTVGETRKGRCGKWVQMVRQDGTTFDIAPNTKVVIA